MKSQTTIFSLAMLATWAFGNTSALAVPMGTAFTYQGRFNAGGTPASGAYDFEFRLFDAATAGNQVGSTVTKNDLTVTEGYFTTTLDFGAGRFTGDARWLQIAVRPGAETGAYTTLTPRHELTPTPYAINSDNEGTANYIPKFTSTGLINSVMYESSNNVGIGTTTPGFKLDVADRIRLRAGASASAGMWLRNAADSADSSFIGRGIDASTYTGIYAGAWRLVVKDDGKVGIGTESPTVNLDVQGGSSPAIRTAGSANPYFMATTTANSVRTKLQSVDNSLLGIVGTDSNHNFEIRTNNSTRMCFDTAGKVGIGTTTPSHLFTTADTGTVAAVNLSNVLYVDAAYNRVGIGMDNPVCGLDMRCADAAINVQAAGSPWIEVRSTNGGYAVIDLSNDVSSDYDMRLWMVGDDILDIDGGNVGIGTSAPVQKLDVAGTVRCVSLIQTSDEQLKTDVQPLAGVLDKLNQVRGVSFRWNDKAQSLGAKTGERHIGVLAQELEKAFPELVTTPQAASVEELAKGLDLQTLTPEVKQRLEKDAEAARYKAVDYSQLTVVLLEAVKELQVENQSLRQRIEALENKAQ
jgi:hypothetical protein